MSDEPNVDPALAEGRAHLIAEARSWQHGRFAAAEPVAADLIARLADALALQHSGFRKAFLGEWPLAGREIVGPETTGPMRGERVRGVVFDEFQPEAPAPRASAERSDSSPAAVVGAQSHWRVITSSEYLHQRHLGNRTLVEEVGVPLTLEKRTTYWAQEPALERPETDIARLHDRFLGDPRFHAAVKHIHFLTEVSIDTGRLTQNDLLRTTAMLERILAAPETAPKPSDEPTGPRFLPDGPINPALLAPADDAIASIPDLHQRWLDDPRFHALVALILDVRDTVHRAGHLPSEEALRVAARAELIVRPTAAPEPAGVDYAAGTHLFERGGHPTNPRICRRCERTLNDPIHEVHPEQRQSATPPVPDAQVAEALAAQREVARQTTTDKEHR